MMRVHTDRQNSYVKYKKTNFSVSVWTGLYRFKISQQIVSSQSRGYGDLLVPSDLQVNIWRYHINQTFTKQIKNNETDK